MKYYCAIIGDIVKSRQYKNRQALQKKFKHTIDEVNLKYTKFIASNFTITLGDEFQGLLFKPYYCFEIIKYIKNKMYPVKFVFGIGIGTMDTNFNKSISIGSDGPAYHYAREMVERAKKKKPSICFKSNSIEDELIISILQFIESTEKNWTNRQKEVIELYKKFNSQSIVAKKLNIKQPSVNNILKKSLYYEIEHAKKELENFLESKFNVMEL